jgi:adenosine deaminase
MRGRRDLAALPKAHLHVHLVGSIRRSTVADLARNASASPAEVDRLLGDIAAVHDMASFLSASHRIQALLRTPEDVDRICREFVVDEAAAGVVYTRPSFVPHDLAARFGMTADELFARMHGVFQEEASRHHITVAYEIAPNRARDSGYLLEAARFAVRHRPDGVVAFGYGGDEIFGHDHLAEAVGVARAGGLIIDPHAGETRGGDTVGEALDRTDPDSVAHGVSAVRERAVLSRLARLRIPCHVSVGSNLKLGIVPAGTRHPVRRMLAARVRVTLNADDTTFFSASLLDEYEMARTEIGLNDAELVVLARNSIRATSLPPAEQRRQLHAIDRWLLTRPGERTLN